MIRIQRSYWLLCLLAGFLLLVESSTGSGATDNESPFYFINVTTEAGIEFIHENGASERKLLVETFGSGLGWIDVDGDGWLDLFLVNGANLAEGEPSPGNVLYRNLGDGKFEDVTKQAGVAGYGQAGTGIAVGDVDADGLQDFFVTNYGPNILYRNNGDGTFSDWTEKAGVAGGEYWSSSAGFFDYDLDGHLDLYVVNYLDYDIEEDEYCGFRREGYRMYCHPSTYDGTPDQLFRNNGDGTFTEVTESAGVFNPTGKGLGVTFADLNHDGHPDIYVANDTVRNFLYKNNGDGTFSDVTYASGAGYDPNGKPQAGMGTDAGDIDGDGLFDLFVTNFSEELNALYRNRGDFVFEDISEEAGLSSTFIPLGFGTLLSDFDNDGDLDIYVTNGHVIDNVELYSPHLSYLQTDLLYENRDGQFREVSEKAGPVFHEKHVGRGAAVADYDNDGDLDLAVSLCGGRVVLMRNERGNRSNWVVLQLEGKKNRLALGAQIYLTSGKGTQVKQVTNVASYLSSNDVRVFFGLGSESVVEQVKIVWPSGQEQILRDLDANRLVRVVEE